MELIVQRTKLQEGWTTGQLYIDGIFFCFTLEDKVREVAGQSVEKWKVKGETAIPTGLYDVTFETSPRFGPQTLTINKVPGFSDIRIHTGNTAADTEGCLIVGYRINSHGIIVPGTTKPALAELKRRVTIPCRLRVLNPVV